MGLLRRFARAAANRPVRLLLLAWVMPVGLMVYNVAYYQSQITKAAFEDYENAAANSAGIIQERANEQAGALKRTSYDDSIELSYRLYEEGLISREEYNESISDFMRGAWSDRPRLKFAAVATNGDASPEGASDVIPLFYGNETLLNDFTGKDLPAMLSESAYASGGVFFFLGANRELYLYHNIIISDNGGVKNIGLAVFCCDTSYSYNVIIGDKYPQKRVYFSANGLLMRMAPDGKYERYDWNYENPPDKPVRDGSIVKTGGRFVFSDIRVSYMVEIEASYLTEDTAFYIRVMAIIALMFLVIMLYYNLISSPVRRLIKAIGSMELSKLGVRTDLAERNEFRLLFGAFEGMSLRLVALQEKTYKEELAARDAKIDSLTSQINPHFINNLLEIISWQARLGDSQSVSRMIDSMVVIMEAAMNRDHIKSVDFASEVGYANAYLNIIRERYGSKLTVNMQIPSPPPAVTLPPLIIQPMLENAVKHGIEPNGGGHITMTAAVEGGELRIDVANSGRPMNDYDKRRARAALAQESYHESVGLQNISQRLKLIYGDSASIELFTEGRETISRMRVPIVNSIGGIVSGL